MPALLRHALPGFVFVAALAAGITGCGKPEPEQYSYVLTFPKGGRLPAGGKLYLGDEPVATIARRPTYDHTPTRARATFRLPAKENLHPRAGDLAVRFETPCGLSKPIPVQVDDVKARESKYKKKKRDRISLEASIPKGANVPQAVAFWVDHATDEGSTVQVGKAKLPVRKSEPAILFGLDCQADVRVKRDGKEAGRVSADGIVATKGADDAKLKRDRESAARFRKIGNEDEPQIMAHYFVPRPATCYSWNFVVYTSATDTSSMGGSKRRLDEQSLYQLSDKPTHFLKEAPISVRGTVAANARELLPVRCKTKTDIRR